MLEFRILGPIEVLDGERRLPLGGRQQRALLTLLLLRANEPVSSERLIDELWGEHPPRTAPTSLHNTVSQLRKLLGGGVIQRHAGGYVLTVDRMQTDLGRFEQSVLEARAAGEATERARLLQEALACWHGAPLADFEGEEFAQADIRRLEEQRLAAQEARIEAELELGLHADVVGELETLAARNPLRERPRALLMRALNGSGRQADALAVYHDARRTLVEEIGVEPGPELQELYRAILRQDRTITPTVAVTPGDHYDAVHKALLAGRLVPVLGADAAAINGRALTALLAERFDCPPEHATGLAHVSQYVATRNGVGPLHDELHLALDRDFDPSALQGWLAAVPPLLRSRGVPALLIVATGLDRAVESAFAAHGEELDVVSYIASGRDRGRFLHVTSEGEAIVVHEPNAYAGLPLEARSVLLKVHGQVDRLPSRERESFAVSEDDHIDYLAGGDAAGTVPVQLAARLRRSHLLFLGYDVDDWSVRVFLRRVWGLDRLSYSSWAVQPAAGHVTRELWNERGVQVYDVELDRYAVEMARQTAALGELDVPA